MRKNLNFRKFRIDAEKPVFLVIPQIVRKNLFFR